MAYIVGYAETRAIQAFLTYLNKNYKAPSREHRRY